MNRIIKFRIFAKVRDDDGCIGYLETRSPVASGIDFFYDGGWRGVSYFLLFPDVFIVQQYTGLQDKNGKEIYEGDIVKFARTRIESIEESPKIFTAKVIELGEDVGEIVYMGFSFCISFDHKRYDDIQTLGDYPHRFEVMGNILENPELL